jgi:hypothetical protein
LLKLLDRARMLLTNLATAAPTHVQSYNVLCPEGHRLRGDRTEGYQALRCPSCGEGLFILPRSPLPDPVAPAHAARTRRPREIAPAAVEEGPVRLTDPLPPPEVQDLESDGEIEWMDERGEAVAPDPPPVEVEPPVPEKRRATAPRPRGTATPSGRVRSPDHRGSPAQARERLSEWVRRRRNPLIFLGVVLIVLGTIGIRAWRSSRQDLPQVVENAREQGLRALDDGRFDAAHQLLSAGKRAVDALGGAVEGADEVRQGADEAAIYTSLVSEPLESILAEAAAFQDPAEWPSRFAAAYQGRSVLIGADVSAVPDGDGRGRYEINYRIFQNGGDGSRPPGNRFGRIDLTGFKLFEQEKPKVGDHVRFGARLASFQLDVESNEWLVRLEPDSGVKMTHERALEAVKVPTVVEPAEDQP